MENGAIGSSAWTADTFLLIYQITYCILMFLILMVFSARMLLLHARVHAPMHPSVAHTQADANTVLPTHVSAANVSRIS
jgi:hypothetical protein